MNNLINKSNRCLHCDIELFSGRSDRKYCNDSCRSSYHNALKLKMVTAMQELLANSKLKYFISEKIEQIQSDILGVRLLRSKKEKYSDINVSLEIKMLGLFEDIRAAKKILANIEIISSDL